ncbi:DUF58 domain-containing protein [Verrucomicrobium spinosum]|uniref:DUF58 domain-containing protein n=1 Tax=Verrucomicrobium spinosum TaxID=2736 RepID=UPI000174602E|nr:DUF58 domain-containing protein [Verrucomicrobium spinosum]
MSRELLDAEAVSQGESLGLMARRIVEGYRVGEHRSPYHGFAIEFAQHREYTAGDDTRHLDWKILGRTDRYYIKQYEQDTNFITHLVVDGSASMNYHSPAADGSRRLSKLEYAKVLAACLAYVILHQRDAVALALVDREVREYLRRTDSLQRLPLILDRLARFQGSKETSLGVALDQVAAEARRRGIAMIFSDLFDDEEALFKGMEKLSYSGQELVVFHVLDPHELTFPFDGTWRFRNLEGADEIQTSPADFRESYLKNYQAFRDRIKAACDRFQAHYVLVDTSRSVAETLSGYLAFRSSVRRRK